MIKPVLLIEAAEEKALASRDHLDEHECLRKWPFDRDNCEIFRDDKVFHPAVTLIHRGSINHKQNQNHLSDGIAREKERKEYSSLLIKFEFSRGENNTKSRQSYVSLSNE